MSLAEALRRWRPWRLRRHHLPYLLLLGLAAVVRLMGIARTGVWHDEAMTIHTARMGIFEQLVPMAVANNQPPLIFLLFKAWAVVSWAPLWLRLFPLAVSLLGVLAAIAWLRLWDHRAGWMVGLLTATSPLLVHYAQEIRGYALLYTCTLAGFYFGERLARQESRRIRVGLLLCACAMAYTHYVGPLIVVMLLLYTWLRGARLVRVLMIAGVWLSLVCPIVFLGLSHTAERAESGYWIEEVTGARLGELISSWTGHLYLWIWQSGGSGTGRAWAALILAAALYAGLGLSLLAALARRDAKQRKAVGTLLVTGATYLVLVLVFSSLFLPIALARTTFPAFIPCLALLALGASRSAPRWLTGLGTGACITLAVVWVGVCAVRAYSTPERRPDEAIIYAWIADRVGPGSLIVVFPGAVQASAGYFLEDRVRALQIQSPDLHRIRNTEEGLRLRPVPERTDSAWLPQIQWTAEQLAAGNQGRCDIFVVDMGPRSASDVRRKRLLEWMEPQYEPVESFATGSRWSWAVRRYLPRGPAGESRAKDN